MEDTRAVALELRDGVAEIALNRSQARNALDYETVQELVAALERSAADPAARVILLRGNGRSFCAGGDLKEFERTLDSDAATYHDNGVPWARLMTVIPDLPVPVIVAAHGHALAGGCGLVAAADIALLAEGTALGMSEIRIGLFPAIVYATLARAVGHRRARELALTGRRLDAAEAREIGLAHHVFPADALLEEARALARDLATLGADAMRLGKELMQATELLGVREGTEHGRAMRGAFMSTDDFRRGVSTFLTARGGEQEEHHE